MSENLGQNSLARVLPADAPPQTWTRLPSFFRRLFIHREGPTAKAEAALHFLPLRLNLRNSSGDPRLHSGALQDLMELEPAPQSRAGLGSAVGDS